MKRVLQNSLAVLVGLVVGSLVNMGLITIGGLLIPDPTGMDTSDMTDLQENIKLLPPKNFVFPFLAHALGTLSGAALAARIAASHPMTLAILIAFFFLAGGISMVIMVGGPLWFIGVDLLVAYIPMGALAGKLCQRDVLKPAPDE